MSGKQRLSSPHFLRRLNEQVRPNRKRFRDDFLFELTIEEFANLKSRFATSSWGGRRKRPLQSQATPCHAGLQDLGQDIRGLLRVPPNLLRQPHFLQQCLVSRIFD
jgi:hypothetical protein